MQTAGRQPRQRRLQHIYSITDRNVSYLGWYFFDESDSWRTLQIQTEYSGDFLFGVVEFVVLI